MPRHQLWAIRVLWGTMPSYIASGMVCLQVINNGDQGRTGRPMVRPTGTNKHGGGRIRLKMYRHELILYSRGVE